MTDVAAEIAKKIVTDAFDSCVPIVKDYIDDHVDTSQFEEEELEDLESQIVEHLERAAEYIDSAQGVLRI